VLNNGHIAPPAKRVHLLTITTSWFGLLDAYRINFQDDTFGFLYCTHQKDDHFIEYMHLPGSSERRRAWYGDFETTVSALHFYLTHKKLTQSGFIKDTSSWTSHDSYLLKHYGNGLEQD
jgi:hypothetical protein